MNQQQQSLETLQDIKKMMERSSRFISLSGLSGISAGICALIGAWLACDAIMKNRVLLPYPNSVTNLPYYLNNATVNKLFFIAAGTFIAALLSALFFTWIKSKKAGIPIWGKSAMRLLINLCIPLIAGGIFLLKLIQLGAFGLVAPGCLIFYGLALINASKYTLNDVRYLGYMQVILGLINLWFVGYGLYFWAFGFGVLHILYGASMWWKYDRV